MKPSHFLLAAAASVGCDPIGAEIRLERMRLEHRAQIMELDRLEDRLLADQARVRLWEEMRQRHQSVSAVACVNMGSHQADMERVVKRNQETRARRGQKVARLWKGPKGR